ncbi:MAG: HD domain-containing protein [Solobacterium sp.]|nr:HD domain-containing protein [Solobacterium sp.]MBQ6531749.1 HD domain-containing protein [Solobacterium sp.]
MNTYDRIPSREEAESILAAALEKNPGKWGAHSRKAAVSAEAIGRAAGLDPDRCYVSGLLHDIGRFKGQVQLAHIYHGWKYMEECGYPLIGRVCLTHSFAMQKLTAYGGAFDLTAEQIEEMRAALESIVYDDYDRLIQLCDNISGASGIMRMEDRIADIAARYHHYPEEKRNRTLALVDYFNKKTGSDIYLLSCGGNTVDHY